VSYLSADPARPHRVTLSGEVDMARVDELTILVDQFRDSSQADVRVDLAGVTFMDSTGLGTLARLRSIAQARGGSVTLVAPPAQVLRLLAIVGMESVFTVEG
jgi:anti-anti-sigma factor